MTKKALTPIFFLLTFIVAAASNPVADLNGHWRGVFMGQYDLHYEFNVDGTTLTGKAYSMDGSTVELTEGKVDGSKISFKMLVMGENTAATGELIEEKLNLRFTVQGYEVVVDLAKAEK